MTGALSPRSSSGSGARVPEARLGRLLFVAAVGCFVALGLALAARNTLPGHWDSINNLATARNIAEGRGFVTHVVQQLATPESLPGPETVRAPGIPWLMAGVFSVFGVSYAAHVVVNVLVTLLTALCVRHAVRESGGIWQGDVAAALVLAAHATFELRSLWNNGFLALLTAFSILLLVRHLSGRLVGWRFVAAAALVAALGFFMKQTFMLGALPFAVGLLITDTRQRLASRLVQAGAVVALFALLTAPYWGFNLMRFGQALYSPIQGMRLPTRYGILPTDRFHRTLRFGAEAYTYATVAAEIGMREMITRELTHWRILLGAIVAQNPFAVLLALAGVALAPLRDWRLFAGLLALLVPPLFDSSYWIMEPRYLFAVFPVTLYLAWIGVRGIQERVDRAPAHRARTWKALAAALVTCAFAYALLPAARQWRWELIASRFPPPGWIDAVRGLPEDAILLAAYPPEVSWYARRRAVIAPLGQRADLLRVIAHYGPQWYLDSEPEMASRRVPFEASDLQLVAAGEGWLLHRIVQVPGVR